MSNQDPSNDQSFLDATENESGGLISEFFGFMRENAKWWLLPFLIVFGLLGRRLGPRLDRRRAVHLHDVLSR